MRRDRDDVVSETGDGRESPPAILGETSLVMSGPGRKMYQSLEPKTEGAIFAKRSDASGRKKHSSRHTPPA